MRLTVYDEAPSFPLKPVERELGELGIELDIREPLPGPDRDEAWVDWLAWHLAWSKVRSPDRPIPPNVEPQPLEVNRERAALRGQAKFPGPFYDGIRLVESFHGPLPEEERAFDPDRPVLVLTDRLMGTFAGTRYHARFLVTGHPTIVSPPGLIDGPARDRSYYMAKQVIGGSAEAFSQDDHLTREDERLPTCIASALLQAAAWHTTGQAFCEEEGCRLFNPHWQKDLLATMATAELCTEHQRWLEAR